MRTLCKICGLTRPEDVLLCAELGADFVGFIFVPSSPRCITPAAAAALPGAPCLRVGVFAGGDRHGIKQIARLAALDYIQLHGGEDENFCRDMGRERVIKVIRPQGMNRTALMRELERFAPVCAYFLLDPGGGGGTALNFEDLAGLEAPRPWFLAGGIGPENLALALKTCAPDGVDCNSRLEASPGVKASERLRLLMRELGAVPLKKEKNT